MKTALICHEEDALNRDGLARWLASFSELVGMVVIREKAERKKKRVKRELKRVGPLRMLDVLAFRAYYKLFRAAEDGKWERRTISELRDKFAPVPETTAQVIAPSGNTKAAEALLRECAPDIVIARCKHLLKASVFNIPSQGTYVMHPGICPEYRNAHGGFWALANGEPDKVGMTLLRIDKGVDTGPVYGHFYYDGDPAESHIVIQHRVVFDHLDAIQDKLEEIGRGEAKPIDTTGRESAAWGQPWLTKQVGLLRRYGRKGSAK